MKGRPPVKVCHLVSGDLWAGAEVMDIRLLEGLRAFPDLELSAIVFNRGRFSEEVRKLSIPVEIVDETRMAFPRIAKRVRELVGANPPDVIHCHWYKSNMLAFLASRGRKSISLVSTQHGMPEFVGRRGDLKYVALQRLNFLLLSRFFHGTVAVSEELRKALTGTHGFDVERTFLIYNGTGCLGEAMPDRSGADFTVGSSGRFFPVKDFPLMVEIARELSRQESGIRFEIAGDGPQKDHVAGLIRRYGIERNFLLRGFLDDVSEFYRRIHVYLNTSLHEGIPMSVLEAMSHGLPVVAPDVGGLGEIVEDGVQGFLVKGRDPRAFADRCALLHREKGLRRRMGLAAKERVESVFSNRRMASGYHDLYLAVTGTDTRS